VFFHTCWSLDFGVFLYVNLFLKSLCGLGRFQLLPFKPIFLCLFVGSGFLTSLSTSTSCLLQIDSGSKQEEWHFFSHPFVSNLRSHISLPFRLDYVLFYCLLGRIFV